MSGLPGNSALRRPDPAAPMRAVFSQCVFYPGTHVEAGQAYWANLYTMPDMRGGPPTVHVGSVHRSRLHCVVLASEPGPFARVRVVPKVSGRVP